MRKVLLAAALVAVAFSASGCAQISSLIGGGSVASTAPVATADAEKALTLAHLAYQGIGDALIDATQTGALKGETAAQVQSLYDKAGAALDAADQMDTAANAPGVLAASAAVQATISQIVALIPKTSS